MSSNPDRAALASFYHLPESIDQSTACRGLACFAAHADNPTVWQHACSTEQTIYCLGQCFAAPATYDHPALPSARCVVSEPVFLGNVLAGGASSLSRYRERGGGAGYERAIRLSPESFIKELIRSGLRGRGGAGFSTGMKWRTIHQAHGHPVIVVNADEGDPGAYSDKILLEQDPFRLLEAIGIAAHVLGSRQAFIYLRGEYPGTAPIVQAALAEAAAHDWPLPSTELSVQLIRGAGSFVCGEETALLNALQDQRPFARARPPYPATHGLRGQPTLVQNVETLYAVVWIATHTGEAFRQWGTTASPGTKLLSLSSTFAQPGLVEVPFGMTLREIVEDIGGGIRRGPCSGLMIGGPLAGVLPPSMFATPLTYEDLLAAGGAVGHGGVIGFPDDISIQQLMAEVFRFGATESCGLCIPCRAGVAELWRAFDTKLVDFQKITAKRWTELMAVLQQTSLCGHGTGMADFGRSIERYYSQELALCLR